MVLGYRFGIRAVLDITHRILPMANWILMHCHLTKTISGPQIMTYLKLAGCLFVVFCVSFSMNDICGWEGARNFIFDNNAKKYKKCVKKVLT